MSPSHSRTSSVCSVRIAAAILAALSIITPRGLAEAAPETPSRIVVVAPSATGALASATRKLIGELRSAGFEVAESNPTAHSKEKESTNDVSPDEGAFATVSLARSEDDGAADVWVVDRAGHKTEVRHLDRESTPDVLAIHAFELVRASLLDLAMQPGVEIPPDVARWIGPVPAAPRAPEPARAPAKIEPKRGESKKVMGSLADGPQAASPDDPRPWPTLEPNPPEADRPVKKVPPPAHRFGLGLGGVVMSSFGGLHAAFGPVLDLRYRTPVEWLDLDARVAAPVASSELRVRLQPELGSATIRHGQADLSAHFRAFGERSVFRPSLGAGLGAHLTDVSGKAGNGAPARHADVVAFTPSVTADLSVRFHERVHLFLAASTVFSLPEPTIIFEGDRVARTGQPMMLGSASVEVGL